MKNLSCLILALLFMTLTFTPNSLTQTPQDDPQQGDFPDDVKVRSEKVNIYDIKYSPDGTRLAVRGTSVFCSTMFAQTTNLSKSQGIRVEPGT